MKTSIIIPTFNKLPRLKLCLQSINIQTIDKADLEIIIIDDGSDDGTVDYIKNYSTKYELKYYFQKNKGRASARNKGIELADGHLLVFIDDDMIFNKNFISEHIKIQEKKPCVVHGKIVSLSYLKYFYDPTQGIYYSFVKKKNMDNDPLKKNCISKDHIKYKFDELIARHKKVMGFEEVIRTLLLDNKGKCNWFAFTGGNTSVLKEWMNEVQGFDAGFGLNWGCEDLELGYRLFLNKKEFCYSEACVNYHLAHVREDFSTEHQKSVDYFYSKHNEPIIYLFQDFITKKINKSEFIDKIARHS
jgi:glycosyltransferase involved in cell wall biosynthesis